MDSIIIKQLVTNEEWRSAFEIMKQLRTDLTLERYMEFAQDMRKEGYLLFALMVKDEIISLAGVRKAINFYNKHHLFVYDLVTSPSQRSSGHGERLLEYIHFYAEKTGAEYVALESGIMRTEAHRFYESKMGYEKWCYSFRKKI
ncbi:GNAT family N-acetyltransferase [Rossellomorea sp. YZS02]|uniref:GNAT family N-acetyltransferase n=1 Tax=Rossellomorea sp. YZS02 TaxID=3097358 RepID=UPI002A17CEEE|nr:GNAT family N-acetyltransferase [Rossellomorea sp. YZS02]MDX8342218.1 GNAT family N-acetyltransferase [Rossellomorea sp. YZS02]